MQSIVEIVIVIMIFSVHKSEASFLDSSKFKYPRILNNRMEAPIMKIDNEIKPIPTFEVKNQLKKKILDLPEIKSLNEIFPKMAIAKPITFAPKLTKPSMQNPKFDLFAKNKPKLIDLSFNSDSNNNFGSKRKSDIGNDENCRCGTDSPICQNEINLNTNNHIPELHEFESKFLNHIDDEESGSASSIGDDNFILVDDQNFSKDDSNTNLRKLNNFLNNIGKNTFKSGTMKRDIDSTVNKLNLAEKADNETSMEKSKRINDSLQKLMQFVTIVGHVDTFLTKKARDTIRKLSVIVDDDDYDYRRNRRHY